MESLFITILVLLAMAGLIYFWYSHQNNIEHRKFEESGKFPKPERTKLSASGEPSYAGMKNYQIEMPDGTVVDIFYMGEPPHGDSYHRLQVHGKKLPGYVWAGSFASSHDSRYLVCNWMEKLFERKSIVIDLHEHQYLVLPNYINNPTVKWPEITDNEKGLSYTFSNNEQWSKLYA